MTTKLLLLVALSLFRISQCLNLRSQIELETQTELATQNSLVQQNVSTLASDQIYCIYNPDWRQYVSGVSTNNGYWVEGVSSCTADDNSAQWYLGTTSGGYYYLEWLGETNNFMSITNGNANTVRFASSVGSWESLEIYQKPSGNSYDYCIYSPANSAWASMSDDSGAYEVTRSTTSCGTKETYEFYLVVS
jgi:hypothetical protein